MKEEDRVIIEELRSLRSLGFGILQGGFIAEVTILLALFSIRHQVYQSLLTTHQIEQGGVLPSSYYMLGSLFLISVASVFTFLLNSIGKRARMLRTKIAEDTAALLCLTKSRGSLVLAVLLFIIPLMDILSRLYVKIEIAVP